MKREVKKKKELISVNISVKRNFVKDLILSLSLVMAILVSVFVWVSRGMLAGIACFIFSFIFVLFFALINLWDPSLKMIITNHENAMYTIAFVILCLSLFYIAYLFQSSYLTYHYSNVVVYKGVNYTVNQTWVLPDSCSIQVYTTNNTLVKDRNLTLNVYSSEFNSKEGVWWACCVMQCV